MNQCPARASLLSLADGEQRLTTSADGTWSTQDLPGGSATLRVEAPGHLAQTTLSGAPRDPLAANLALHRPQH
ncbi:MAG TPA: carboxypeptidase-like regulatory domain-containing protein [Polyangiaceae bacterium]